MSPFVVELIGVIATIFVVISMLFKTTSVKGSLFMRCLNIAGSVVFIVYGCLLPAVSTAVLNGVLVIINTYHLVLLIREQKSNQVTENKKSEEK
jgi:hypothetical protein